MVIRRKRTQTINLVEILALRKSYSSDKFESGDGYKKRSFSKDGEGGESGYKKKPYSSDYKESGDGFKKKTYSNDKFGGESGFKKKSYSSDKFESGDGFKKRSFSKDEAGSESGYKKRPYSSDKFESGEGYKKKTYSNDGAGSESGFKKKSYSSDKFESGDGYKKRSFSNDSYANKDGFKKKSFGFDKSSSEGGFKKKDYSKSDSSDKFEKKSFSGSSNERYKRDDNRKDYENKGFVKKSYNSDDSSYEKRSYPNKKPVANTTPEYYNENEAAPFKTFDNEKRLNQYIASTGLCSRREADVFIETGCITVNGEPVTTHGTKVSSTDEVRFNGEPLESKHKVYVLLNKPKDYVTTTEDPQNRKTVYELVKNATKERVFSVGRLDRMTTGVLLFTNDGELTNNLMHPKYNKKKIYQLELDIPLTAAHFTAITDGINLEDGFVQPDALSYVSPDSKKVVGIEIHSGKNRIVRRIFEHFGYTIKKLDRVYFAGLTKKNLSRGEWRHLTEKEVAMLKRGAFE
ncbi:MAG: rRNA pseudouridine synthase [Bacteroidales bacterium]|nr:rRNA pseudouridine synthase [Bacteroidales bacterium]